ncbi:MAG: hypothetical protein GXP22_00290 [Gammaproteobacteria bacterium]|nr:hypothetical protein [Gammaproteobacteria bacterium]
MTTDAEELLERHKNLVHSEMQKVISHVQRNSDGWILNTVMIEDCDAPFKYKRKKAYKNLQGARVNLTYYPATERVAGMKFEIMNVVRIRLA